MINHVLKKSLICCHLLEINCQPKIPLKRERSFSLNKFRHVPNWFQLRPISPFHFSDPFLHVQILVSQLYFFLCLASLTKLNILILIRERPYKGKREFEVYDIRVTPIKIRRIYLFSARERAEFNKSCNLIGSWSGRNFLIRTATAGGIHRVDLFSWIN